MTSCSGPPSASSVGGRIGYILFYDFASVVENPIRALEIWNGGMSFHGGLIGTLIAMILIFARKNGIAIWSLFDIVCAVVPIGLFFGRIANFINAELWGRLSSMPWAIVFPTGGPFARHPSQLYEAALEGICCSLVLAFLVYRRHAPESDRASSAASSSAAMRPVAHLRRVLP